MIGEMFRACIVGDCVCCGMGDMSSCIGLVCVCVPSIKSFTVLKHIVLLLGEKSFIELYRVALVLVTFVLVGVINNYYNYNTYN